MNLFECIPRVTEITELDVQRQKIDMVEVKQMKTAPIVLSFHMKFFYSYKMASYILSQKSSLFLVLCKTPRRSYMNCTPSVPFIKNHFKIPSLLHSLWDGIQSQ